MAITVFADVIVPNSVLSAGIRGKQVRSNARVQSQNGTMQINTVWARTLRQYEIGFIPMLVSQWQTLEGLFEVTEGGAYGMLLADPKDVAVDPAAGLLYPFATTLVGTIGLGYGVPTYKLHKRYTAVGTSRTKDRAVTRPQATPTPVLKRGGATVTLGAAPGNAAIDYTTGTVTFVADSSSAVTAVSVGATTQVTLTAALAGLSVGQRLYLSGLAGTVGSALNGASHAVTAITGGALNVYTLSVSTTGLAWTSGGTGFDYPQASETLTWGGAMYVPVHFASDEIDWELVVGGAEGSRLLAGPTVMLMEVRE
jgi:uncharacterized protein (TIGR02217 family)